MSATGDFSNPLKRAAASHTKGGLSMHMAPGYAPVMGSQQSPDEYRKRKVALLTGAHPLLQQPASRDRTTRTHPPPATRPATASAARVPLQRLTSLARAGITGQDGSYLTELLLEKGYEVHGMCVQLPSALSATCDRVGFARSARLFILVMSY